MTIGSFERYRAQHADTFSQVQQFATEFAKADDEKAVETFVDSLNHLFDGTDLPSDALVCLPKSVTGVRMFNLHTGENIGWIVTQDPDQPLTTQRVARSTLMPQTERGITVMPRREAGYLDLAINRHEPTSLEQACR